MFNSQRKFLTFVVLAELSLLHAVILQTSVALNLAWVRSHAAGGQFDSFPLDIRVAYAVQALIMLFPMAMLWNHRRNPIQSRGVIVARVISGLFGISTILQLISPTSSERWNAIPAAVIAMTFWQLSKRVSP